MQVEIGRLAIEPKERIVDEKAPEENKFIAKMRMNTEKQGRRTGARPYRRTRMKVLKNRKDGSGKGGSSV